MRVEDVMTKDVVAARPESILKEVARLLAEHGISGLHRERADLIKAFVRPDDELEHEIREEILRMLLSVPAEIAVTIAEGDVALAGEVETQADAEALLRVIERVTGVVSVDSGLTWRENGSRP